MDFFVQYFNPASMNLKPSDTEYVKEKFDLGYEPNPEYKKPVAYFCMEYAIDQALKIYSGGLGFLAGSHLRSAYSMKQNLVGIGILWKYGYYDQFRKSDRTLGVIFREKDYHFLEDTGIQFPVQINNHSVQVKALYLRPEIFGTAPLFLLSTDLPENDYLARSATFRLYDSNSEAKIAQSIILGVGGVKLLNAIGFRPELYHLNEAHALPAAFHLYHKHAKNLGEVQKRIVLTTHTPVEAGNEKRNIKQLHRMGFFEGLDLDEVRNITRTKTDTFNHTLAALRMCHKSNGVSRLHGNVARDMWGGYDQIAPITHITNSQNRDYWQDTDLREAQERGDLEHIKARKKELKEELFRIIADQTGRLFDPEVLTMVWARRFAPYKRADLIIRDAQRFDALMRSKDYPIQIIWAGKPYPTDQSSIHIFNRLNHLSDRYDNMAVLIGYELSLSKALKDGSDIWLNTPRVTREASGTSGMTAAMNASINVSTNDGWMPEFAEMGDNSFILPIADQSQDADKQDIEDLYNLYQTLENEVLPMYYSKDHKWWAKALKSMNDVTYFFDSHRMADQYYTTLYN